MIYYSTDCYCVYDTNKSELRIIHVFLNKQFVSHVYLRFVFLLFLSDLFCIPTLPELYSLVTCDVHIIHIPPHHSWYLAKTCKDPTQKQRGAVTTVGVRGMPPRIISFENLLAKWFNDNGSYPPSQISISLAGLKETSFPFFLEPHRHINQPLRRCS